MRFSRESKKLGSKRGLDATAPQHGFDLLISAAFCEGQLSMSPLPPREWTWPSLKLSYSDPTEGKFLQGTAGCAPHRTIGSQTRSPPSPSLLHPREGGSQTPLVPSFLLRFVQWEALAEDQTTSRRYSQDGFSSLSSALGTTVNTSPGRLVLTQSVQPGDAARPAFLTPLRAPEKEAGMQSKRGARGISEEWMDHRKTSYTWAGLRQVRRGERVPPRPRSSLRARSPWWKPGPRQGQNTWLLESLPTAKEPVSNKEQRFFKKILKGSGK